ncbi:hypothetical protein D3C81_1969240 [compost metagenome]
MHVCHTLAAVAAQRLLQLTRRDALPAHHITEDLALVNEDLGPAFHQRLQAVAAPGAIAHQHVGAEQRGGQDQPGGHGVVAAIHGVLHRVRDDQQQHQVQRRQLADLALARHAHQE